MDQLILFWDFVKDAGPIGLCGAILFFMWKEGIIKFNLKTGSNGKGGESNGNGYGHRITTLEQNVEGMRQDLTAVVTDVAYIRGRFDRKK